MKRKMLITIVAVFILYIASYILFRQTHIEIWEKNKTAYVIFPDNKIFYYMYRPISLVDGRITGMMFHINQHQL